jgi:hypothetical protein
VHGHARDAACRLGDQAAEARALSALGAAHAGQGRYHCATELLDQALIVYKGLDDRARAATTR